MKLKSIPNLGTRTIHLPVIGDTKVEEGIIEVSEENLKEFFACNCGYSFVSLDGKSVSTSTSDEGDPGNITTDVDTITEAFPLSNFETMTVNDMRKLVAEDLDGVLTEEEKAEFKSLRKQEMITFLHSILNSERVQVEEEEIVEEDPEAEKGAE